MLVSLFDPMINVMCRENIPSIKEEGKRYMHTRRKGSHVIAEEKERRDFVSFISLLVSFLILLGFLFLFLGLLFLFPGLLFFFALLDFFVGHFDPFANVVVPAVAAKQNVSI